MKYRISVIIPTFNRSSFLKRALVSVINQSISPNEIIVVDNGSTENTKSMLKENFTNIKYIFYPDKGVSKARNIGIKNSNCDWLCFLDSDDEWHLQKLEKQIKYLKFNSEIKFLHTDESWFRNGVYLNQLKKHEKSGGNIFENSLKLCCVSPSSTMINKDIFRSYGLFDETFTVCEDYELWLRITAKEQVGFLKEALVIKHGGHKDQLSKKYWGMDRFRVCAIEKNIMGNNFTPNQKNIAIEQLLKKLIVILNGAKKRNNNDTYNKFKLKYDFWKNYHMNNNNS